MIGTARIRPVSGSSPRHCAVRAAYSVLGACVACASLACVPRGDELAKTSSGERESERDDDDVNVDPTGAPRSEAAPETTQESDAGANRGAGAGTVGQAPVATDDPDPATALASKPSIDPADSPELLPLCNAPLEATFGHPTFGTKAVRLHWRPETGECKFTSGDGTPEGWSGILTLRHRGEDLFLAGIGEWKYFAPNDLELDALPEGQSLTFYPYLENWQFVVDISYVDDVVTIERFQYIEGEPPKNYGIPDETSNEPAVQTPMLVPCSSLSDEGDDGAEATERDALPQMTEAP